MPADRLGEVAGEGMGTRHLDLDAELAPFGADTVGGLGVSWPAGVTR